MIKVDAIRTSVDTFELRTRGWIVDSCDGYLEQAQKYSYFSHTVRILLSGTYTGQSAFTQARSRSTWAPALVLRIEVREPYRRTSYLKLVGIENGDEIDDLSISGELLVGTSTSILASVDADAVLTSVDGISPNLQNTLEYQQTEIVIGEYLETEYFSGVSDVDFAALLVCKETDASLYCIEVAGSVSFVNYGDVMPRLYLDVSDPDEGELVYVEIEIDWAFPDVRGMKHKFIVSQRIPELTVIRLLAMFR